MALTQTHTHTDTFRGPVLSMTSSCCARLPSHFTLSLPEDPVSPSTIVAIVCCLLARAAILALIFASRDNLPIHTRSVCLSACLIFQIITRFHDSGQAESGFTAGRDRVTPHAPAHTRTHTLFLCRTRILLVVLKDDEVKGRVQQPLVQQRYLRVFNFQSIN